MTMSDQEVRIFNLVEDYAASKDFHLSETPQKDSVTKLVTFKFAKGALTRSVSMFEADLMLDANSGVLSENTKRAIDDALAG
jgi:hypothetical protein